MRDFPIFTTEYGVSSLILREIPYRGEAYIRIQDVQKGKMKEHLAECISFCRMAGADKIYGTGDGLEDYPEFVAVVEMRGIAKPDQEQLACLFPVTEQTASQWREIYNNAMRSVDNARTLESRDQAGLLQNPGAYFVHDQGTLLGIGWMEGNRVLAVAAVRKGAGQRVMHTLMSLIEGETVVLDVASTNGRAIRLYEKMGFIQTRLVEQWYDLMRPPKQTGIEN